MPDKVTLREIYEICDRLEKKVDDRMNRLEGRVNKLESKVDGLMGKIGTAALVGTIVIGSFVGFMFDNLKQALWGNK